jgi:hypothetical protein
MKFWIRTTLVIVNAASVGVYGILEAQGSLFKWIPLFITCGLLGFAWGRIE